MLNQAGFCFYKAAQQLQVTAASKTVVCLVVTARAPPARGLQAPLSAGQFQVCSVCLSFPPARHCGHVLLQMEAEDQTYELPPLPLFHIPVAQHSTGPHPRDKQGAWWHLLCPTRQRGMQASKTLGTIIPSIVHVLVECSRVILFNMKEGIW